MRKCAQLGVTVEALAAVLGLADGVRVARVLPESDVDATTGRVRLLLEGECLPLTPEGAEPMMLWPHEVTARFCEGE